MPRQLYRVLGSLIVVMGVSGELLAQYDPNAPEPISKIRPDK